MPALLHGVVDAHDADGDVDVGEGDELALRQVGGEGAGPAGIDRDVEEVRAAVEGAADRREVAVAVVAGFADAVEADRVPRLRGAEVHPGVGELGRVGRGDRQVDGVRRGARVGDRHRRGDRATGGKGDRCRRGPPERRPRRRQRQTRAPAGANVGTCGGPFRRDGQQRGMRRAPRTIDSGEDAGSMGFGPVAWKLSRRVDSRTRPTPGSRCSAGRCGRSGGCPSCRSPWR